MISFSMYPGAAVHSYFIIHTDELVCILTIMFTEATMIWIYFILFLYYFKSIFLPGFVAQLVCPTPADPDKGHGLDPDPVLYFRGSCS